MMNDNSIELIKKAFSPIELDANEHATFFDFWECVAFKKGDLITEQNQVERYFYVVETGIQMVYLWDKNGEKKVIGFSFDGSFSGVYDSFVKERPSNYILEAMSSSKLWRINLTDFNRSFELFPILEQWGRKVHLELLIGRVDREVELITTTAEERFTIFEERCPEPLRKIPQKYIASYLNMSAETYSRLRKKSVS
jgi:CRP-like cAMP-binding protein